MKKLSLFLLVLFFLSSSVNSFHLSQEDKTEWKLFERFVMAEPIGDWHYVLEEWGENDHVEHIWNRSLDGRLDIIIFNHEKNVCPKRVCPKGDPYHLGLIFKDPRFEFSSREVKIKFVYREQIILSDNGKIDENLFRLLATSSKITITKEDEIGRIGEFDFNINGFLKAFNNFKY